MCIDKERTSTMLMTKNLQLPHANEIKNALRERLITVDHNDSYLCERAYTQILYVGGKKEIQSSCKGLCTLHYVYDYG